MDNENESNKKSSFKITGIERSDERKWIRWLPTIINGLILGATSALVLSGVKDYDKLIDLQKLLDTFHVQGFGRDVIETGVEKVGLNSVVIGLRIIEAIKSAVKAVKDKQIGEDDDKKQVLRIKDIKSVDDFTQAMDVILKKARKGIVIGSKIFAICCGMVDVNGAYSWDQLPHKIAQFMKKIDMNKVAVIRLIARLIPDYMVSRWKNRPHFPLKRFYEIFDSTFKSKRVPSKADLSKMSRQFDHALLNHKTKTVDSLEQ